ncbi:MAG: glycosyltransferase family 9 protein [Acidobacteria bacterium]|nr:glycosyltransferase family 9 protein [Acidobacteriota bacterium]MBI3427806.1 glycosyltransferase family 9 protein [Acidobacteriota bacterium]
MRILIVRLGAIGDVVHTLPALAALRRTWPQAYIAWAVERGGAAKLLADTPYLDDLIELDLRGWRKRLWHPATWRASYRAVQRLHESAFDVALDFQGLLKSAGIVKFSRALRRVGFATEALREKASAACYTEQVAVDDRGHIIEKNLQLAAHLGCEIAKPYVFPLALNEEDRQFAAQYAARGSFAILNPGGGWVTKLWSTAGFAEIADRLWQVHGLRSFVTYGPGEEALARAVVEQSRSGAAELLNTNLKEFVALALQAKLFVGGDTGPMHLAAAASAPIVALFGPTSARRNGPFAAEDVVVERFDLDCRTDCYRRQCSHISCMKLPVEMVWQGIEKRLRIADCGLRNKEMPVVSFK